MAEPNPDTPERIQTPSQRLLSDLTSPVPQNHENPSKLSSHFLFRTLFITIFIALLPFLPSQAPEFINHTIFTRSWELLHLLLVGIAVSYGVFSRRNVEVEKEVFSKPDNSQSYVSKMLEVSAVFDDEIDSPPASEGSKIQTWNRQYFRGEPVVVVSEDRGMNGGNDPLLLPVRSLKSPVSGAEMVTSVDKNDGFLGSSNGSSSPVMKGASNSPNKLMRNGSREIGEVGHEDLGERLKESVVLPSPIPWRSRSGRMEVKDELGTSSPPLYHLPPSVSDSKFDGFESPSFHSQMLFPSPKNLSPSPSPKNLSPSPSLSPELRGKNGEVLLKKKGSYRASPPPPPPPPPPPISRRSQSYLANSSLVGEENSRSSFKDEGKNSSTSSRENRLEMKEKQYSEGSLMGRIDSWGSNNLGSESFRLERKGKHSNEGKSMGKSVSWGSQDMVSESFRPETKSKHYSEGSSTGKSVRMIKQNSGDGMEKADGKGYPEVEDGVDDTVINARQDQLLNGYDYGKPSKRIPRPPPKYPKKELVEKHILEEDNSKNYDFGNDSDEEDVGPAPVANQGHEENEVDKKADEFIAKFREQIRLQRIESIKRSTKQRSNTNLR